MAAPPFPSSGRMDAWPERRGLQPTGLQTVGLMNLRSVFTADQQRILERYYDNGMTNQSKACFQHILQCAQESKLDFSVVRTWVGNKRRKLASKADQNGGGLSHSLSNQGLAGGLLPNHTLAGGALSNHHSLTGGALVAGAMLTAEMAAARNIQNRPRLVPLSTSFPAFSSTSSSTSSSPLSAGNNNNNSNNDVILTGIYSLNSASRPRPRPVPLPSHSDSELSSHAHSSLLGLSLHNRNTSSTSPLHSKLASLSRRPPALSSSSPSGHSGPSVYTPPARKGGFSLGEAGRGGGPAQGAGVVPHSWARQYGTVQPRSWPSSSSSQTQPQVQPRPHSNPQPHPPAPPRARVSLSLPVQTPRPSPDYTPRIQQVFTLSDKPDAGGLRQGLVPSRRESHRTPDPSGCFSIAMETGDEEDEWRREEELANMSAQRHAHRGQRSASLSPARVDLSGVRGGHTPPITTSSRPGAHQSNMALPHGSYSVTAQTSPKGESSTQTSVSVTAAPWFLNNSRKRTLQDRTQFSDRDLLQLKRYWDRGMTSLGSVCREKIAAAADQLNVDSEIVKTWISNRRRKYRLMGIEIPAPKGGPAVFTTSSSPGRDSPLALSPDGDGLRTPEFGDDLNDGESLCLSEDGNNDSYQRDLDEDGTDVSNTAPLVNNVKIEIIDEDEDDVDDDDGGGMVASNMEQMQSLLEFKKIEIIDEDEDDDDDDDGGGMVASNMEQMQSLLEFKHEEVQFLESELLNQKQKYQELEMFTSSLLNAVRNNDLHKQQELLASLPQPPDMDWDVPPEEEEEEEEEDGAQPVDASTETSPNHDEASMTAAANGEQSSSSPPPLPAVDEDFPVVTVINEDGSSIETTQPSASEELPEETDTELQ